MYFGMLSESPVLAHAERFRLRESYDRDYIDFIRLGDTDVLVQRRDPWAVYNEIADGNGYRLSGDGCPCSRCTENLDKALMPRRR